MCWHNYTQHSGCGHYGEVPHSRYTLCPPVHTTLLSTCGPSSPPSPPKRSNTTKSLRLFSLSRSNTTTSTKSSTTRRTISKPQSQFPDHEILSIARSCPQLQTRTLVSSEPGRVCAECEKWIDHMRNMIWLYDRGRGVRGNKAFGEFLEGRRECRVVAEELGFGEARGGEGADRDEDGNGGRGRDAGDELFDMRPLR